ncbi:MAG: hypothetical protein Q8K72_20695, partial [Acidimicrobiales bacterium]|nr:hypothetical protein [Acidimicrobiales bacterium]
NHPEKVASDIHDLIRLVTTVDVDDLAERLHSAGPELAAWVATTLVHWFSADADQRYTFARLRRLSNTVDARAVDQDELSLVGGLGQAVLDTLS